MKNQPFIITLLIRIIAFPFFAGLVLVGTCITYIGTMWNFFRYGSETIVYTRNRTRTTIQDVFEELKKSQEDKK